MVNLVWIGLWAIAGWLIGILLFFIGGLLVSPLVGYARRTRIADYYSETAMKLIRRAVLVERGTKYSIYKSTHDPEKNADTFTMDGETAHVTNDTGLLSTLHKRPLGLVPPPDENIASYVSPEIAEWGQIEAERKETNTLRNDDGTYKSLVDIGYRRPLVHLRDYARRMIPGNRSLYDLDETVDLYKQSQMLFGQSKTTQFMILIIAYVAGMGAMWFIMSQGGGAGGGGGSVPTPPIGG